MALNIPEQDKYLTLPDEMFVPGAGDDLSEEIVRPSTTYGCASGATSWRCWA